MEVKVSTRHGHLRDSDKELIEEKLMTLTHIFNRLESVAAVIDWDRHEHHLVSEVEILVNAEHKHDFIAKSSGETMELMPAVNQAVKKMETQLRKYKERVESHRK